MNSSKPALIISLSDLGIYVRKTLPCIFLFALLCGVGTFIFYLRHPIQFTAEGIFKGQAQSPQNTLFKAFELLGREESYASVEDPRYYLKSYPVLAMTVKKLALQGMLSEKQIGQRLKEIWYTLKAERGFYQLKKRRTPSLILTPDILVPEAPLLPDRKPPLLCTALIFESETASTLNICFSSPSTFSVTLQGEELGMGTLGTPFVWQQGSFTLTGHSKIGSTFKLHLIPLDQAIQSLQRSIDVVRDRENGSLFHIYYTHTHRHLAASIVNTLMEEFQNYLKLDGQKKVTKQLSYLRQRQEEALEQLEIFLVNHKHYLEAHLGSGEIVLLEKELDFLAETQLKLKEDILQTRCEIERLAKTAYLIPEHISSFSALMGFLKEKTDISSDIPLSIESIQQLMQTHQLELDRLFLAQKKYTYCLQQLNHPVFDSSSLSTLIDDKLLSSHFETMYTLHHRLIDEKNWSGKEREQFREELEIEKTFLKERIELLNVGIGLQETILKEKITSLEHTLLSLLCARHEQKEKSLSLLAEQARSLPQKWLNEQKIDLNTKFYTELMESIGKMIESKNIDYHLEYLMASILKQALPPSLPDPPCLLFKAGCGLLMGLLISGVALCFYAVWRGPRASEANLAALGYQTIHQKNKLVKIGTLLAKNRGITLLSSKKTISLIPQLVEWLTQRGDRVYVIDFNAPPPAGCPEVGVEIYCASDMFRDFLTSLQQEYTQILLVTRRSAESLEINLLAERASTCIYGISNEPLLELESLPPNTFFFIQPHEEATLFSLSSIFPFLEKLTPQRFTSSTLR